MNRSEAVQETESPRMCEGRICIVTGGGRGIGREHALMLARHGASVVVNDFGGTVHGSTTSAHPADSVVREIQDLGGIAMANHDDVADWEGAKRLIDTAVEGFGGLDVVVNNAGIIRDRMLVNMSEEEWDAVIRVHLKGTFAPTRWAADYWRGEVKNGRPREARVINTTSISGIYGNVGQSNYGAAKAGIAAFTVITALELQRYGVTVNALAPVAFTRMTEGVFERTEDIEGRLAPQWVAPVCTWLASSQSTGVTGRVFEASGELLAVAEGWVRGPAMTPCSDPVGMDGTIRNLLSRSRPNSNMDGRPT